MCIYHTSVFSVFHLGVSGVIMEYHPLIFSSSLPDISVRLDG